MSVEVEVKREIVYPESDGKPMADNTLQAHYIVYLFDNLKALFRDDLNVFVAANLLWYPVEGEPNICTAPDVMVVFGRPKGHRRSYLQWQEENIPPQVVFEVWSPSNTLRDFVDKLNFYEHYGVEEFYFYDPDKGDLMGWVRKGERLVAVEKMEGWVSPRLGIMFTLKGNDLVVYYPDGEPFVIYEELREQWLKEKQRAEQERQRAERMAQKLRELGIEPEE